MSALANSAESAKAMATKAIMSLDMSDSAKDQLISNLDDIDDEEWSVAETEFRQILDDIPSVNDDGCDDGKCSASDYQDRARRVAKSLRDAAKLLP